MSYVLGVVAAILMTFSVALGYWYLLSHYLEQRRRDSNRVQKEIDTRIAARLARIKARAVKPRKL
jgi:hypothetical protein